MFSSKNFKSFKYTYFEEHLRTSASNLWTTAVNSEKMNIFNINFWRIFDEFPFIFFLRLYVFLTNLVYESLPGYIFKTQLHIQTHIRLNMISTLATKHLMIIDKDNLSLHFKDF